MYPTQIGRFEIKSEIGHTVRATVFQAYDPQLQRDVALKLLKNRVLYTTTSKRRYEEAAQKLLDLKHPSIVPILDFGDENNRPYFVISLEEGGSLSDRLQSGPLATVQAIDVFLPIAGALDHAASQGIIHRDLKPSNILFDRQGHPLVSELGLMQVVDSASIAKTSDANPEYVSPEQVRGLMLDGRSHVYSLGAIVYHAPTGQPLFQEASDTLKRLKHVSERPRRLGEFCPDLLEAVEKVILKSLAKRPKDRYQTAAEFIQALAGAAKIPEKEEAPTELQPQVAEVSAPPSRKPLVPSTLTTDLLPEPEIVTPAVSVPSFLTSAEAQAPVVKKGLGRIWLIVGAVGVMIVVFWGLGQINRNASMIAMNATATTRAMNATATTRAIQAVLETASNWPLVLFDDFSSNVNDWGERTYVTQLSKRTWSFDRGKYKCEAEAYKNFIGWHPGVGVAEVTSFYLAVTASQISNPEHGEYGVIFRKTEDDKFYVFKINEQGQFAVSLYSHGIWEYLLNWQSSPAIQVGEENRLAVLAQGTDFLFFINDQFVADLVDERLKSGKVSLMTGIQTSGESVAWEFDDFELRSPDFPSESSTDTPSPAVK